MNGENYSVFRRPGVLKELSTTSSKEIGLKAVTNRSYSPIVLSSIILALAMSLGLEMRSSWLESRVLAAVARKLTFSLGQGASEDLEQVRKRGLQQHQSSTSPGGNQTW
jgi:hypothetical protein